MTWNDAWGYTMGITPNGTPAPWGSVYNPISPLQTVHLAGWQCPGCNACYAPSVAACWHCLPQEIVTATGANDPDPGDDGECVPPEEGGTCKGGRHCSC